MGKYEKFFNDYEPSNEEIDETNLNASDRSTQNLRDALHEIKSNVISKISQVLDVEGLSSEEYVKTIINNAIVEINNRAVGLKKASYDKLQSSFEHEMNEILKSTLENFQDNEKGDTNSKVSQVLDNVISENIMVKFNALLDPMREGNNSYEKGIVNSICFSDIKEEFLSRINIEDRNIARQFSIFLEEKMKTSNIKSAFNDTLKAETVSKDDLSARDAKYEPRFNDDKVNEKQKETESKDIASYFNS